MIMMMIMMMLILMTLLMIVFDYISVGFNEEGNKF